MRRVTVPGFGKKSKKPNTILIKQGYEPLDDEADLEERQQQFEADFQALISELSRVELEHSGTPIIDRTTGVFRWPACWADTMQSVEWAEKIGVIPPKRPTMEPCTRLEEKELSPMSDKLREIAAKLHLPLYKGKAPPGEHRSKPRTKPWYKESNIQRKRCPKCGTWLQPVELVKFRKNGPKHALDFGPKKFSGTLMCAGCGFKHYKHEDEV